MNLMGGLLVGGSLGWYLWGLIQDARHTQGRHRRRFLEKLGGRSVARHLVHTEEAESVVSQPASEGVQLRRNISRRHPDLEGLDAIPFDQLKFVEEIGHGAHGVVFRGKYSGADVAIKQIPISPDGSNRRKIQVEVGIFLGCRHPHLVQCLGVSDRPSSPPKICIVTEYCRYGSLDDLLHRKQQRVTDKLMMQWMKEVALGMVRQNRSHNCTAHRTRLSERGGLEVHSVRPQRDQCHVSADSGCVCALRSTYTKRGSSIAI
jgi:hypothetical protein